VARKRADAPYEKKKQMKYNLRSSFRDEINYGFNYFLGAFVYS
jgi:hypothetical protein